MTVQRRSTMLGPSGTLCLCRQARDLGISTYIRLQTTAQDRRMMKPNRMKTRKS